MDKIRSNVCEFPYEFGKSESRARFTMTTGLDDPTNEVNNGYNT